MIIDEENNSVFLVSKINSLKNTLNRDVIDLNKAMHDMKQLDEYNNARATEYYKDLMDPIQRKGVKIPSEHPVPTCSFQLHNYITFGTNELGCDAFGFNPFFLASDNLGGKRFETTGLKGTFEAVCGTYFYNNYGLTDGAYDKGLWYAPGGFSQVIPDVYSKYRLVSACAVLRYTGALEEAKGTIGVAITYDKSNYLGGRVAKDNSTEVWGLRNPLYEKYGNFSLMRDSYYNQENSCLEGLKVLYFPLDKSFEEFKTVFGGQQYTPGMEPCGPFDEDQPVCKISDEYIKSGFNWIFYCKDVPYKAGTRPFRLDFYSNYECIPNASFLNYLPTQVNYCYVDRELKEKAIEALRKKVIMRLNNVFI